MTNQSLGLWMLDEPFEHMPVEAASRALRSIEQRASESLILFVTHNPAFVPRDGKHISVQMKDGIIEVSA